MAGTCISDCINKNHVPSRRAYVNRHHERSESDWECSRSIGLSSRRQVVNGHPVVVDSISCRQLYLRSYTFTKKESVGEKTRKCFVKVGAKVKRGKTMIKRFQGSDRGKTSFDRRKYLKMAKDVSCAALSSVYRRLLSCSRPIAKVDVHDDHHHHHHGN